MKCRECETININKADYCKKCGYHFSSQEQKDAKSKTLVGKLEKLEELYNKCTLKVITDHIAFKILSLVIVLLIGLSFLFTYGNNLKILESEEYTIQYNTKTKEYYLIAENYDVNLNLYKPNRLKKIEIIYENPEYDISTTSEYKDGDEIILTTNSGSGVYILRGTYNGNKTKDLKVHVYQVGDIDE